MDDTSDINTFYVTVNYFSCIIGCRYLNQHEFTSLLLTPQTSNPSAVPLNLSKELAVSPNSSSKLGKSPNTALDIKVEIEDPVDVEGDGGPSVELSLGQPEKSCHTSS